MVQRNEPASAEIKVVSGSGFYYTVRRGDSLSGIARRYGLPSWRTMYRHAKNEKFRDTHPNPNLIYPGDRVWLPDVLPNQGNVSSGSTAAFTKQPPPKIASIKLASLTFTTAHDVLLDNKTTWTDSGGRYLVPEWTPVRSCPITHTKNKPVKVSIELRVLPADAQEATGQLKGTGSDASLTFEGTIKLKNGKGVAKMKAKKELGKKIAVYDNEKIKWQITVGSSSFNLGATGPHRIYATYGEPAGGMPTEKRVAQVVSAARDKVGEQDCVNAIFDDMMRYEYKLGAPYPEPVWLVYGGTKAECNALADLFKQSCLMLGLPDKFVLGHIYPLTRRRGGKFDVSDTANESRLVSTTHPPALATTHGVIETLGFRDFSVSDEPSAYEGWNNFEGAVKYGSEYYCVGEGRFSSPTETMESMVVATAWGNDQIAFCRNPGPCPEWIWDAAQWASILRPC